MEFVSRSDWRARHPRRTTGVAPDHPSTVHWNGPTITIRGSATFDHRYCPSVVRGIQNFHMDSRGWNDIAYNFCVCQHGYVFEGRGMHARSGANGYTAANRASLAIMYLGGTGNPFPVITRIAIRDTVAWISRSTSAPDAGMVHRDWKSTECPGATITRWVHGGMPVPDAPTVHPKKTQEVDDMLAAAIAVIEWSYLEAGHPLDDRAAAQGKSKWIAEARAKAISGGDPWDAARTCRDLLGLPPEPTWPS